MNDAHMKQNLKEMLLCFSWASLDLYNENAVVPIAIKHLYTAYRRRRVMNKQWQKKYNICDWTISCAFQSGLMLFSVLFSGMSPQLTGPFEVSLKAEWSVPGLAVLWGVLIPLRWASRGVSVWLSSFLITPERSEQLLLSHICVSISRTYEVTYAGWTGPCGAPLSSPLLTWLLSCTQLSECLWVYLAALILDWVWLFFLLFPRVNDVWCYFYASRKS